MNTHSKKQIMTSFWLFRFFFTIFCWFLFKFFARLKVEHKDRLPEGPFIIAANHSSHVDTPALMRAIGRPFSHFAGVAAKDYFFEGKRLARLSMRLMNIIPLDRNCSLRNMGDTTSLCKAFIAQKRGVIIMYPEGTRSQDGTMKEFKLGVAALAAQLQIPIVPAYIDGADRVLPKKVLIPKPTRLSVAFAKPIDVAAMTGETSNDKAALMACFTDITQQLEHAVLDLKDKSLKEE